MSIKYSILLVAICANISLSGNNDNEITLLRSFINAGDLVFDVGAHKGLKTDLYLSLGAHVIDVEPQPDCIEHLRNKYADNDRVIIEPIGLASRPGNLEFSICSDASTISTFSTEWQTDGRFSQHGYVWDKKIIVAVNTLDHLIAKYGLPHFCKIDVENFELEVLKGLTQPIPYLSFEFSIETLHNTQQCVEYLMKLGYRSFNFATGLHYVLMLPEWVNGNILLDEIRCAAVYRNDDSWGLLMGDIYARYN